MADSRTVAVRLTANVSGYQSAMRSAAKDTTALDKAQEQAQRTSRKWEMVGTAAQVGGATMAAGLLLATKAASNQEQALGSLSAVFKSNGAAMQANAKAATQLGLSTTEYATNAAKLGSQLGNLGVTQDELAGTTDGLIKKAADLAAQYGGTTTDAVDALGAAMRGEADPAERYGLALNATAVNAEMAATGANKAQAMIALINKQMERSGAVGAWNREIDTAAARTQIAQKEFDNAAASLGEGLLPAMSSVAGTAADLLEKFNALPQSVKSTAGMVALFAAGLLVVGPRVATTVQGLMQLREWLNQSGTAAGGANSKMRGFAATAGKIAAVGTAAAIAIPIISELLDLAAAREWGNPTQDLSLLEQQLVRLARTGTGEVGRFSQSIVGLGDAFKMAGSWMEQEWGVNSEQWDTVKAEIEGLDGALAQMVANGHVDDAAAAVARLQEQTVAAGGSAEDVTGALPQYSSALDTAKTAADNAASATDRDAAAKEAQAAAVKKAAEQYQQYIDAVQKALGLLSARDALIGQEDRLTDAIKKNGRALRGRTQAAADNRAAIANEVSSISDLVQATYEETGSLRRANSVRRRGVQELLANAEAAGYNRAEVRALLRQLDLLKPINTSVTVTGLADATGQAQELVRQLQHISGLSGQTGFGAFFGRATGGYISGPGGPTDDKIPAMLSNGEYVMRASAVDRLGVGFFDALNYARGGVVGYARGGRVAGGAGQADMTVGVDAAMRSVDKWRRVVARARDTVQELRAQRRDMAADIAGDVLGQADGIFDTFTRDGIVAAFTDLAAAQDKVAESSQAVYDAQVAVNTASPEDRAAALDRLADAQRNLATAQGEQGQAEQALKAAVPTPTSILAAARTRAKTISEYGAKVRKLMGKGLSLSLIKQLAGADMMQAGPVLDALLAMSPAQLKELGDLDRSANTAARAIGANVSRAVNRSPMRDARVKLGVDTRNLDRAIKTADDTVLTPRWRRVLAKAGLGAEERAELMESLRDNDGKLTRHWRNILAKAGLSAEERADLVDAILGADRTLSDRWRNKLAKAGLSAEERVDLMQSVDAADGKLTREWRQKLAAAGLGAEERAALLQAVNAANTKLDSQWRDRVTNTGLGAQAGPLDDDIRTKGVAKARADWETRNPFNAPLGAQAGPLGDDIRDKGVAKATGDWEKRNPFNAPLGAQAGPLGDDIRTKGVAKARSDWESRRFNAGLGAAVNRASIAAAIAAAKSQITGGFAGFTIGIGATPPRNRRSRAAGGYIAGPGTGTSDSIPAWLSNGEYVIRAASVNKYGRDFLDNLNAGRYATGGPVGWRTTTAPTSSGGGMTLTGGVPVVIKLDSRTIAVSQLKLQRQSGGTITVGG